MKATDALIEDLKLWACSPRVPLKAQIVMIEAIGRLSAAPEVARKPDAVDEFRCALSTIAGLAKANGSNALHEISCTALAGIERLKLMTEETIPSPLAQKQEKP